MTGDAERADRQRERVRHAARRLRLAEAEALAALDGLRAELAMSMDADEGYAMALADAATAAGLDPERAARMICAHQGQVRAARVKVDADAAVARWARAG